MIVCIHNCCIPPDVMLQEYLSLGIMQRKHFSLEHINSALNFMETLTSRGTCFEGCDAGTVCLDSVRMFTSHRSCQHATCRHDPAS